MNRVVITGFGMITAAGVNAESTWKRVAEGNTAIDLITNFDTSAFKAKLAAEVKDFNPELYVSEKKEIKRIDRYVQFALAASEEAAKMSGLDFEGDFLDKTRCGVIYGSGVGGIATMESEVIKYTKGGPLKVSPLYIPMMIANMAAGHLSIKYGLEGHGFCPVTACATSSHAIGEAYRAIKHGYADVMFTGGSEAAITPVSIAGFQNTTTLSHGHSKEEGLLAFDHRRTGFVMGEGGGTIILENYDLARKRGAVIYGEVVGYCATFDAHHITSPSPDGKGASAAMSGAIKDAGIDKLNVGYINAHGTGTQVNDKFETIALKSVFGGDAYKIKVSSTKGVVGHMLGAAGVVEAIICIKSMINSLLPPTANLYEADPECDLDYIPLHAQEKEYDYALSSSLGFGSTNAALVFKKWK